LENSLLKKERQGDTDIVWMTKPDPVYVRCEYNSQFYTRRLICLWDGDYLIGALKQALGRQKYEKKGNNAKK